MSFKRHLLLSLRDAISKPTPVIHVLIGPRQVGKTTIARQIQESVNFPTIYATADSPVPLDSAWIETHWRRAVTKVDKGHTHQLEPSPLIIENLNL